MNLKQLESRTIHQHWIIGAFKNNYIYKLMSVIAIESEKIIDREFWLNLVEDFYSQSHLEKIHFEEGIENITTISTENFLSKDFFNIDSGSNSGFLHITMGLNNFKITFDRVDFPNKDFLKKFPEEVRTKTYKGLWKEIKRFADIRDSLQDEIDKLK